MQNDQQRVTAELRSLLSIDMADIVATANQYGFATRDILVGLEASAADSMKALEEDPDPADDSAAATGVPSPDLVDKEKTPGTRALAEPRSNQIDPDG